MKRKVNKKDLISLDKKDQDEKKEKGNKTNGHVKVVNDDSPTTA